MTELEDLLRLQLAELPEPTLVVPAGLGKVIRRRAHRRRVVLPAVTGALALAGAGTTAVAVRERPSGDRQSVETPAAESPVSPSSRPCSVAELIAQGGPRSMVEFAWPSGATLVLLETPPANCPIELMLSSPRLAAEDLAAAEQRWGPNVRLAAYDAERLKASQGLPSPTSG